ncbi:MAG: HesA/MoeB/ThiF family protein [Ignavibacteria bacterium]
MKNRQSNNINLKRYDRQTILKEIGVSGQEKLMKASVLVIGAGGIGCPLLSYLSAAGVGKIGIADYDKVELTNLHRQVLYYEDQTGRSKAFSASENLLKMNSETEYKVFETSIGKSNGKDIICEFDIIADATDNFKSRYIINDLCVTNNKPFVWGAVNKFELQVAVFNYNGGATFRCAFPENFTNINIQNCEEQGVIGPVPGMTGMLMAAEVIKIITGSGEVLSDQILIGNILRSEFKKFKIKRDPAQIKKAFEGS